MPAPTKALFAFFVLFIFCSAVNAGQLCPATMAAGEGKKIPLSGLTIMRFKNKSSQNLTPQQSGSTKTFILEDWSAGTSYRAACEYDDEIIGVEIESKASKCTLEKKENAFFSFCV